MEQEQDKKLRGEKLPEIPSPISVRWREFRTMYVPLIVFGLAAFAAWSIWRSLPPISPIKGIGEGAVSIVASPQDGFLQNVAVEHRGWIEAGQQIATLVPFDPRSSLDLLSSRLAVSRLAMEPALTDRNAFDYERLRVEALQLRQNLALAQANLERVEKMLPRHEKLAKEQLLSQDIYEQTLGDRNFYRAEVEHTTKSIAALEERLEHLQALATSTTPGTNPATAGMLTNMNSQIDSLQTNWNPIPITAPIAGEVLYWRQAGEFVSAGEQLLVINAPRAERIVAYLKQPLPFEPEVGMTMEIITQRPKAVRFETTISQVGARLEILTNAIAYVAPDVLVDSGLPVIMPVPAGVSIRPGEIVSVVLKKGK